MFNLFYFTRKTNWEISVMRLASRFAPLPRFECRRWLLTNAVSIKHQVASYVVNLGSSWGALGDCLCNNLNTVPNITFREEEREVSGAIWNKMPPWMRQAGMGRGGSHWCRNHKSTWYEDLTLCLINHVTSPHPTYVIKICYFFMLPCGLFLRVCLWLSPSLKESCLEFRILSLFHSFSHFLLKLLLVLTSIPIHLGREFLPCETRYPAWLGRGGGGRRGSGYDKRKHFNKQQGCLGKEWGGYKCITPASNYLPFIS